MQLIDLTLPTAEANLGLDESLFRRLEAAGRAREPLADREVLRFWESPQPVVVLGRSGRIDEDVDTAACERSGVPIRTRASGGGTVLLGPGCLCFALVLAYERRPALRNVAESYRVILGTVGQALGGLGLEPRGETDLAFRDRKVSGNAQLRGRYGLLHQGTLLQAFEPALLPLFLREPRRQPSYRGRRRHVDFVGNLPLTAPAIKSHLVAAWGAQPGDLGATRDEPERRDGFGY